MVPMRARIGRVDTEGDLLVPRLDGESEAPTLFGVAVTQADTFIDERRVLVVSYNRREPPGTLGYSVVVQPGYHVGDHYHHHREERIVVLHGRAEFRLLDQRNGSATQGVLNVFTLDYPGCCVRIPTGVAHSVRADGTLSVLQVLASCDYDPSDDVHLALSAMTLPDRADPA